MAADDLGLEALAQIQALEARPAADAFRVRWLGGEPLPDGSAAHEWLKRQMIAELPDTGIRDTDVLQSGPYIAAVKFGTRGQIESQRVAWYFRWERNIRDSDTSAGIAGVGISYEPVLDPPEGTALHELGQLAADFSRDFGQEWLSQTVPFVLLGTVPVLQAVAVDSGGLSRRKGTGPVLSSPMRSPEVLLRCRVQATNADVSGAYQTAQRRLLSGIGIGARERTRPVTSPRTRDLAVFGAHVALGEYASWGAAMLAYSKAYPDDETYTGPGDHGRFRRDVRRAYQTVTGFDLTWTPKQDGTPPVIFSDVRIGGELVGEYRSEPGQGPQERGIRNEKELPPDVAEVADLVVQLVKAKGASNDNAAE